MLLNVIAICIGASVGALSRWGLALWLAPIGILPFGTLAANLIGGLLIGVAIGGLQAAPHLDPAWRLLIVTGFLGGLTTFSSFSGEVVALMLEGRPGAALLTVGLNLGGSLLLTYAGLRLVGAITSH